MAEFEECYEKHNIRDVIDFLGLADKENVVTSHLNLFDKKLTMLGNALVTRPKLLMVDEPIGGLSPTETTDFMAIFKRINQEWGITMIIIEHLMKVLTELSTRMMIIHNGAKVILGLPEEVCCDQRVIDIYLGSRRHA